MTPLRFYIIEKPLKNQEKKAHRIHEKHENKINPKHEARSTKSETNSNDQNPNEQNKNKRPRNTQKTRKKSPLVSQFFPSSFIIHHSIFSFALPHFLASLSSPGTLRGAASGIADKIDQLHPVFNS
jgi:hypothetical protein